MELVTKNKVVTLTYVLKLDDGEIVDSTNEQSPFAFIHGIGQTLEKFDANLVGKKPGDTFAFSLTAEEGYGIHREDYILELPIQNFMHEGKLVDEVKEGATLPMQDEQGNPLYGTVIGVTANSVSMDFNHPLAGETLHFSGKILQIRDAEPAELAHGHVHGPHGHHH